MAGVLLALALGACNSGNGGAGRAGDQASTTPAPEAASGYHAPGEATPIGAGLLEGVSRDGSAVYVSAPDASPATPVCGSAPEPALFRVPLGGGPREPLGVTGRIARGPDGRVALVTSCQGALVAPRVATETADGHLRDVRSLELAAKPALTALAWAADGQSLVTARTAAGARSSSVARVDLQSGRSTPLFDVAGAVSQLAQLAEGTYVVAGQGKITLRDGTGAVRGTFDGEGFTVSSDRRSVAVWGQSLILLGPGDAPPATLASAQGEQTFGPADFSSDGTALAYATTVPGGGALAVVTLQDRRVTGFSAVAARQLRVLFSGDGKTVAFSHAGTDRADEPALLAVRFRI